MKNNFGEIKKNFFIGFLI